MVSTKKSNSTNKPKISEANQDWKTAVTDNILKRLPLSEVAKTSVLSTKWRQNWLYHNYLVFDETFWKKHGLNDDDFDLQKMSNIISNILFHHNGIVRKFYLHIPGDAQVMNLNLSQWISFLSKIGIRKLILINDSGDGIIPMPSHIFACKELVKLSIDNFELITPATNSLDFSSLRSLELIYVELKHDLFATLIGSCPRLSTLSLENCNGISNLVIDNVPLLENLSIIGNFTSLAFKNVFRLQQISLSFTTGTNPSYTDTIGAIKILAMQPYELQYLEFNGLVCKFLGAGRNKKLGVTFNHLQKLCLKQLLLSDFDVFCFTIGMVQSCPFIKDLEISICTWKKTNVEHKFEYDDNYKLGNLLKAKITGITGSSAELKLIQYLLRISVALEKLLFKCVYLDLSSELEVSRQLLQLPRSSPKAKLVYLKH